MGSLRHLTTSPELAEARRLSKSYRFLRDRWLQCIFLLKLIVNL